MKLLTILGLLECTRILGFRLCRKAREKFRLMNGSRECLTIHDSSQTVCVHLLVWRIDIPNSRM